jgi:cell division septal protein FtsQ
MSDKHEDEDDQPAPRRGALIALIVVVALVAGGIWISQSLRSSAQIQDCVMSGRSNCAPVR